MSLTLDDIWTSIGPHRPTQAPRPPQTLQNPAIGLIQPEYMLMYAYTCLGWDISTHKWTYVISDLASEWPLVSTFG